jgi:hypothetical protein
MIEFFKEGGWGMYPILVVGLVLLWSSCRYALDREPARRPFIAVLTLAYLAFIVQGVLTDIATVFWALSEGHKVPPDQLVLVLLEGMKESTRPAILGFGLMGLALVAVSIGLYRSGLRELRAALG